MHADKLPITGPCPIDLDAIGFDRKSRVSHCQHCVKSVHNLSTMTESEATAWMHENQGKRLCISYARTENGKIRFAPEPSSSPEPALVPLSRLRSKVPRRAGLAATLGMGAALAACAPHGEPAPLPDVARVVAKSDLADFLTQTVVTEPTPEPIPTAGVAMVPDDMLVEGDAEVPPPDDMLVEGDVKVPSLDDEPCGPKAESPDEGVHEPVVEKAEPAPRKEPAGAMAYISGDAPIESPL